MFDLIEDDTTWQAAASSLSSTKNPAVTKASNLRISVFVPVQPSALRAHRSLLPSQVNGEVPRDDTHDSRNHFPVDRLHITQKDG
jgi:hypothetical protein